MNNSETILSNELKTEIASFIAFTLEEQSQLGPSIKVSVDWSSAIRLVVVQLLAGAAIWVIYSVATSGL
jgi:hypothetical protein